MYEMSEVYKQMRAMADLSGNNSHTFVRWRQ
jgi:hypothetical protein